MKRGKGRDNFITTLNPVWSVCNQEIGLELEEILFFTKEVWIQTRWKKEKKIKTMYLIDWDDENKVSYFLTGFIPRVFEYLKKKKISFKYEDKSETVEYDDPKNLGLDYRDYQFDAIHAGIDKGRGVIKAATGTGKTIIMGGIISAFSHENILILADKRDIIIQTAKKLDEEFKIKGVTEYRKGKKESRIMCSTIQTFNKVVHQFKDYFDVVLIDEGHHVSSFNGMYSNTIENLNAPVKLAFTATMPVKSEAKMALEGLVGPQIFDYTIYEAIKDGHLSKPKMKFVKSYPIKQKYLFDVKAVPSDDKNKVPSKFRVVYWNGVVVNEARNIQIALEAANFVDKNKSVLINVVFTEHGNRLMDTFDRLGYKAVFIYGKTKTEERERVKEQFKKKKIKLVIASTIWKEGVDIPSIDVCINAAGYKAEIGIIQSIGRGLRKTKNKNKVVIIDMDDSDIHRYLEDHFNKRMKIYKEMGWI